MGNTKRTACAFVVLGLTSVVLAQQTNPAPAPLAGPAPPQETAPPETSNARRSEPDARQPMKDCLAQVRAASPSEPESEIESYCDKQVKAYSPH